MQTAFDKDSLQVTLTVSVDEFVSLSAAISSICRTLRRTQDAMPLWPMESRLFTIEQDMIQLLEKT